MTRACLFAIIVPIGVNVSLITKQNEHHLFTFFATHIHFKLDLEGSQKETLTCKGTNDELNEYIKKTLEKLTCCENEGHDRSVEMINLKNDADDLKKSLGICKTDNEQLSVSLNITKSDLSEDQQKRQEEIVQLKSIQINLNQCILHSTDMETKYESEKTNVLNLTNKIASDRAECEESRKKSDEKIESLLANLNECKESLECVKGEKASIEITVNELNVRITEIQKRLDISLKDIDEAHSKTHDCEDNSKGLKSLIEQLQCSITDKTTDLTKLTAEKTKCDIDLKESQSSIISLEKSISATLNDIKCCKTDLNASLDESSSCRANNNDMTNRMEDITEKLARCKDESHGYSLQVITLKNDSDDLKNILATYKMDNAKLLASLNITMDNLNDDQRKLQEEIALQKAAQSHLEICNARNTEMDECYQKEKELVLNLTNKIAANRVEYDESSKKYDEQIKLLLKNMDESKILLKSVTDEKTSIETVVQNLSIQINESKSQLDKCIKSVDDATSGTKKCVDYSNGLEDKIKKLECDLTDESDELRKCAKHSTSLENDLKDSKSNLITCNDNLQKSESSITDLKEKITSITNIKNKCDADVTKCNVDLDNSNNDAVACRKTISEMAIKIEDASDKLSYCQKENHDAAIKISDLKSSSDEVKKNWTVCQIETVKLKDLLDTKIELYTEDERKLHEEIERMKDVQASLDKCDRQKAEVECNLKAEQITVLKLTNEMAGIRTECDESKKTYEAKLESSAEKLNQCEDVLKSVTAEKISIGIDVTNLNVQIIEINKKLDISRKDVDEANEKIKQCEVDSNSLKNRITELDSTVSETSAKLSKCTDHSASIENDLKNSESKVDQCNTILKKSDSTIAIQEETITNIQKINQKLNDDMAQCGVDLDASRKETNACTIKISNLNIEIDEVNERLNCCRNEAQDWSLKVITLKNNSDNLKKNLGACEINIALLTEAINLKNNKLTDDERKLQEEIVQMKSIQINLDKCIESKTDMQKSYDEEKALVANLTDKMAVIHADYGESSRKDRVEIDRLIASLNECKDNLQSVTEDRASIVIVVENLKIQITKVQNELDITLKVVDEAHTNIKTCEDKSNGQKDLIDKLQCTVTEKSTDLTRINAENTKCGINLNASQSLVVNLKETIDNLENVNNKLTADEAQCKLDLGSSEESAYTCRKTNDDLTIKINDMNERLSCCQNEGRAQSVQINDMKSSAENLKISLGACEANNTHLSQSLDMKMEDYNEDERKLHDKIASLLFTQSLLDLCNTRNIEMTESYKSEHAIVVDLTNKIAGVNTQCEESRKKYEEEISGLLENLQEQKNSLKCLGDEKLAIEIDVKNLNIEITKVKNQLEITLKNVEDANSKTKRCEDTSNDLKHAIEQLECDIKQKSIDITMCSQQSASLQKDLKDCGSKSDKCNINLQSSKSEMDSLEKAIENIENINKKLTQDSSQCKLGLGASLEESSSCHAINNDMTVKIKEMNERLSCCSVQNYEYSVQVGNLKNASDVLKNNLDICEHDKVQLSVSLNIKMEALSADEKKLQDELAIFLSTQSRFDLCNEHNEDLGAKYASEKGIVADLTQKLEKSRLECEESSKKCNEQIEDLQVNVKNCKENLNSETKEVNNLNSQVNDIKKKLENSLKAIEVANSNIKQCEGDKLGYENELSSLRCTFNNYLQALKDTEAKAYKSLNDGINSLIQSENICCKQ